MKNKKPLLVTLADKHYLEYAKQVFAGAYFNAGWQGDYMLLAHDIPEKDLKWFRKKGILIKHCRPLYDKRVANTPPSFISRLYVFTPEFKKWSHVIYIDTDVIIRGSLDRLLQIKKFASVVNIGGTDFRKELINEKKAKKFLRNYNFREKSFCAGFFVLNTSFIEGDTFEKIMAIINKYQSVAANADQFALNLYFYKKWMKLPAVYDLYITDGRNQWGIANKQVQGIILHFVGKDKPWLKNNYFFREWSYNLGRTKMINLNKIPKVTPWREEKIAAIGKTLAWREKIFYFPFRKYLVKQLAVNEYYKLVDFFEKYTPSFFRSLKLAKKQLKELFNFQ